MNNKDFDQFIKKSMEGLKDDMPSDWSAMEQKLNMKSDSELSSEMEDIYLDGVAYDHLKNLQEPFEPANWDKMSARLDEEYAYRRKVAITKAMEIVVVLLLLWTGVNFFPNKKVTTTPIAPVAEQQAIPTPNKLLSEKSSTNTSDLTSKITTTKTTTSTSSTESILADNSISHNTVSTNSEVTPTSTNENPFFYTLENFSLENEKPAIDDVLSIESRSMTLDKDANEIANIEMPSNLNSSDEAKKIGILKRTILAIISPLKSKNPSELKSEKTKEVDLEKMLALRKAKSKGLIVSMFGSSDYNLTTTPYYNDETRTNKNFHRNDLGYGGGITIGFQTKKLFIETGLVYHFVRYNQFDPGSIFGDFKSYTTQKLGKAELNLVQIPLHFQYQIYQRKRWNIYGLAGGALNLAVQNNFEFQESTSTGYRSNGQQALSNLLPNYDGILEGGDLKTNSYLTANLGIGIERYFSYRWSMFVQPVYRYNLFFDGIGPKDDYINSGSIQIGTKVRLRK